MSLEDEIQDLKERLEEKDDHCHRAAEIGKALLEQKIELQSKLDDVVIQYSRKVEALEQDNYSQSLKLETHRKDKEWCDEELSQLKSDLQSQRSDLLEQFELEKQQDASRYKKQVNELKADYEQAQSTEKQLKEKVQQLEELVQQQLNQTQIASKSFNGDELFELQQELLKLQADNTGLTSQMIDGHSDLKYSQEECTRLKTRLIMKDEDIEELQCQMTSYCNSIEKLRTENTDLSAQLEALRMEASVQNSKGNSIFSEVEDRRVEAEKRLITSRVKYDTLKDTLDREKQLHQNLKMQMVMLLQISTGQNDSSSVSRLQSQLTEARADIQELMDKLEKYENNENFYDKNLTDIQNNVKDDDKEYVQYLITMLKSKETEMAQTSRQLRHKNLQLLDSSNKVLSQQKSIVEMEQKQNNLRGQYMKLQLKVEELQLKYEPEQVPGSKHVLQRNKEKIPLEEEKTKEVKIVEKINPNLGASFLNESTRDNIPTRTSQFKSAKISFKKTVSISDAVDVVSESGLVEKQNLSDIASDISKLEFKAKAKPKRENKVKQVKVENTGNVNECKNQ